MTTYAWVEIYREFVLNGTTYTEDGLHKPVFPHPTSLSDGPPLPDTTYRMRSFQNVTPKKGKEFSELEVPLNYSECSPLFDINRKTPKCLKIGNIIGWIDSLEPVAVKGPSYNTLIRWHIDYYLTGEYIRYEHERFQFAPYPVTTEPLYTLGAGRIRRGPSDLARPDPSLPRKWIFSGNSIDLTNSKGPAVVVLFNDKNTNGDTVIKIASWWLNDTITPGFQPITIEDIYSGLTEECMGLDPDSVIGIYFAPFMPIITNNPKTHQYLSLTYGWYETQSGQGNVASYWASSTYYQTTDAIKWVVLDPLGTTYATMPWHVKFNSIESKIDIGTSGASLILTLLDTAESYPHQHLAEGRRVQIPLISAPVTSNAMASYVLSGKQEYDRAMATIQQEQNFKSGIANAGTGAIGGAIAGSAASPGLGTVAGLVGGAASSILGSYFSGEVQKETDRKSFEALDKYTSNQTSSVIISAGGTAWVSSNSKWMLVGLTRDTESAAELSAEQSELGYVTDSYTTDCTSVAATGGGLRIEGVEVRGGLPPEGRAYIAALFARGVHLDLIQ